MQVYRANIKATTEVITFQLPSRFIGKEIEIVIKEIDEAKSEYSLQDLLRKGPVMTKEQEGEYQQIRKQMEQWDLEKV